MKKIIISLLAVCALTTGYSQTNTPSGSFFNTAVSYFTSFNTNLDSTFGAERGEVWTGVDSIQGGGVSLANALGISYNVWKSVSLESVTRNSGVAGTLVGEQLGVGLSFVIHDAKLTIYGDAGYIFEGTGTKFGDRIYGEIGLRVSKALTAHTFAGVGIAAHLPQNTQIFSAFAGFTF